LARAADSLRVMADPEKVILTTQGV
jgi:hypothetical protein